MVAIEDVIKVVNERISATLFGVKFKFIVSPDLEYKNGRFFLQLVYDAPCTHTNQIEEWKGTKSYLSKHMTMDEIVKRCWVLFEAGVKHELMEGFKVDGIILFNPHVNFEELLKISHKEVRRDDIRKN